MKVGANFVGRASKKTAVCADFNGGGDGDANERKPSDRKKSAATRFWAQNAGDVDFLGKNLANFRLERVLGFEI